MKEHFNYHNVEKEKESLCNEVTKVKNQIVSGEHIALNQRSELQKLARIVQEADEERQRQVRCILIETFRVGGEMQESCCGTYFYFP